MITNSASFLKQYYKVSHYPGVYVLGCFARRVTLYSQQVRALNLIFALHQGGELAQGSKVAVIGGGAAGLTAAVAAARCGAKVRLWDKLQGPMELQQNNRQRWIHPFIYDWPYLDEFAERPDITLPPFKGDAANLPLLSWSADYAANVAQEIGSQWQYFRGFYRIKSRWNVEDIHVRRSARGASTIVWKKRGQEHTDKAELVILAVGFGLESIGEGCDSYWTEDNLDATLRKPESRMCYLVSGAGDGAFTDLMRLCIRRFRQDEILNLLMNAQGIDGVIGELRRNPPKNLQSVFKRLPIHEELLEATKQKLRATPHRPEIFLVSPNRSLYGPETSILNRLGVLVLQKLAKKPRERFEVRNPLTVFRHIVGRTEKVRRIPDKPKRGNRLSTQEQHQNAGPRFKVALRESKRHRRNFAIPKHFHGVLIRHGPKSLLSREFNAIWRDTAALRSKWKRLSTLSDETRTPQWPADFFEPELSSLPAIPATGPGAAGTVTPDFVRAAKKLGVWADTLSIHKSIRSDGSSNVTYTIEGLSALEPLHGVYFYYKSSAGIVDRVVCSSSTPDFQLKWSRQVERPASARSRKAPEGHFFRHVENARRRARVLSGFVWFKTPLMVGKRLSFSLSFRLVAGDALSSWEFSQMYSTKEQVHVDGKPLGSAIEYFFRAVWFPVKTLKLRITLPKSIRQTPVPGVFTYPGSHRIRRSDVFGEIEAADGRRKVLYYYPAQRSRWRAKRRLAIQKQLRPPFDKSFFKNVSPQTWELSVATPSVGSCYSLEWKLPQSKDNQVSQIVLPDVTDFRKTLLEFRVVRNMGRLRGKKLRRLAVFRSYFAELCESLRRSLHIPDKDFEVSLMTYKEKQKRLVVTYGIKNGHRLDTRTRDFWLPFGLGLAGSCFKQGSAFILQSERKSEFASNVNYYLPLAGRRRPKFLATIPLDHPLFERVIDSYRKAGTDDKQLYLDLLREPSRESVGVINITSMWHFPKAFRKAELRRILRACQTFCADVHQSLHGTSHAASS